MNYSLGLNIGITWVGWCVLDLDRQKIADLGVRLFKGAENPKDGSSPAVPRREARRARRTLRRKRSRIKEIKRLIVRSGMITQEQMNVLYSDAHESTPWELREAGLDRKLSGEEWARVLIHIAKYRGYKSNRKAENDGTKKNVDGIMVQAIRANAELLSGKTGKGYRTVGEMMQRDIKFAEYKRNKAGDYSRSVTREATTKEVTVLFECQRRFDNPYASTETEEEYLRIFSFQRPFVTGVDLEKRTGRCALEPDELRAPRASWTAERFVLLSRISNLRLRSDGHRLELEPEKKKTLEELAYKKSKVKYKDIRKALGIDEETSFEKLPYAEKGKDPEDAVFIELKSFHTFKAAIGKALGDEYWEKLITTSPTTLDVLAYALTYRKTDQEILEYLEKNNIPRELTEAILPLNFAGNVDLSLKAMSKLIPFMETQGCRYEEACRLAGYSETEKETKRSTTLPIPAWCDLPVPVGVRAISQVRKIVNAVVGKYGSPRYIRIELSRDLSMPMEQRRKIAKEQEDRKQYNEVLSQDFEKLFGYRPDVPVLEKYRLWKDQDGICPYTGGYIDPSAAFMSGNDDYAQIDHIIPYSRSFDDSRINKVLVIGRANKNKGNKTPYEYFGGEGKAWETFVAGVNANFKRRRQVSRLLIKDFGNSESEEMKARLIGDTRYITRYVSDWLEKNLLFADKNILKPVTSVNVMATSVMRRQWGLNRLKDRTAGDLRHALDACIVAAVTPETIQKISEYSQKRELGKLKKTPVGIHEALFAEPWVGFGKEVEARLSVEPATMVKELGLTNYTQEELAHLKPVIVSMRPERKAHGAAHDETVRSAKYLDEGKTAVKTPLSKVKLEHLERMVGKERDTALYEALKKRLLENGNNPRKAFAEEFRKPTRDGRPGPLVRSIKIFTAGVSGVNVNDGLAYKSVMVRVDMYRKDGRHYAAPYYVSDIARRNNAEVLERNGIDSDFEFVCSFFRYDLIAVTDSHGKRRFGYYDGYDTNRGSVNIISPRGDGKDAKERVSVKTAKSLEKYEVDMLGEYHKVRKEKPFV